MLQKSISKFAWMPDRELYTLLLNDLRIEVFFFLLFIIYYYYDIETSKKFEKK